MIRCISWFGLEEDPVEERCNLLLTPPHLLRVVLYWRNRLLLILFNILIFCTSWYSSRVYRTIINVKCLFAVPNDKHTGCHRKSVRLGVS